MGWRKLPDGSNVDSAQKLKQALRSLFKSRRAWAIRQIAELGPRGAEFSPHLVQCLGDRRKKIRDASVQALVAIGPSSIPALIWALDSRPMVRKGAEVALRFFGERARAPLTQAAKFGSSREIQDAAAGLLLSITREPAAKLIGRLEEALYRCLDSGLTGEAFRDFLWGDNPSFDLRLLRGQLTTRARELLPEIEAEFAHKDPNLRCQIVFLLGHLGEVGIPSLMRYGFCDHSEEVRKATRETLGAMGLLAVPALRRGIRNNNRRISAESMLTFYWKQTHQGPGSKTEVMLALPELTMLLGSKEQEHPLVASQIILALNKSVNYEEANDPAWVKANKNFAQRVEAHLAPLANEILPSALRGLGNASEQVRASAAWIIARTVMHARPDLREKAVLAMICAGMEETSQETNTLLSETIRRLSGPDKSRMGLLTIQQRVSAQAA